MKKAILRKLKRLPNLSFNDQGQTTDDRSHDSEKSPRPIVRPDDHSPEHAKHDGKPHEGDEETLHRIEHVSNPVENSRNSSRTFRCLRPNPVELFDVKIVMPFGFRVFAQRNISPNSLPPGSAAEMRVQHIGDDQPSNCSQIPLCLSLLRRRSRALTRGILQPSSEG